MEPRVLVKNAADAQQVRRAERKTRDREAEFQQALTATLSDPAGRMLVWGLLDRAGINGTIFDPNGSQMYFKEGRRNFGFEIQALAIACDEDLYLLMEREGRARQRRTDRETDAAHMSRAEEETTDG